MLRLFFALGVLLAAAPSLAQVPHETLYGGLAGNEVVQAIRNAPAPATRGYGPARDSMYTWEQRTFGRIRCVYTGFEITIPLGPGQDASTNAFNRGINAEHTWPQSQGAGSEPQQSDLHNLFPTREGVNSSRGNLRFGESPDVQTTNWYRLATTQTALPTTAIDEWSERLGSTLFEPREDHKGNGARAMLYFYARWPAANGAYLSAQLNDLVAWHEADPVDAAEWARHEYVARLQGNRNPFVVDPTLARRTFLPTTVAGEAVPEASAHRVAVHPNPSSTSATVRVTAPRGTPVAVTVVDALGRVVWSGETVTGEVALPTAAFAAGVYVVRAAGASARLTVTR